MRLNKVYISYTVYIYIYIYVGSFVRTNDPLDMVHPLLSILMICAIKSPQPISSACFRRAHTMRQLPLCRTPFFAQRQISHLSTHTHTTQQPSTERVAFNSTISPPYGISSSGADRFAAATPLAFIRRLHFIYDVFVLEGFDERSDAVAAWMGCYRSFCRRFSA